MPCLYEINTFTAPFTSLSVISSKMIFISNVTQADIKKSINNKF